ncbi:MAG: RGCVC family protein [Actinomycetota bacterium]|nr:RGCVC family protein [Actinomycetota bacterium]
MPIDPTTTTATTTTATATAGACPTCAHPRELHDRIALRYCEATAEGALSRGCVCAGAKAQQLPVPAAPHLADAP